MNERIKKLSKQAGDYVNETYTGPVRSKTPGKIWEDGHIGWHTQFNEKFAGLIVAECVNREALLGAIARGWCSEKNSHKTMDSDLAVAIFDQVEQQIRQQFGVEL
jgi:hypothetical protein